jgi:hypothetical protein
MITFTGEDTGIELNLKGDELIIIPTNLTTRTARGMVAVANRLDPEFSANHADFIRRRLINKRCGWIVGATPESSLLYSFPVKHDPKERADLSLITTQMASLVGVLTPKSGLYRTHEIRVPRIGSGLGRLRWEDVYACIEPFLMRLDEAGYRVVVYSEEMEA